jgi:hypothetical protein
MKIQIPKTFMGKPVAGSLEKVLAGNGNPTVDPVNPQIQPLTNAPDLQGYVYVPSIGLYVAKQRTHIELNWNQTHEALQNEALKMPTIPQFLEFLKFLQNGYQDRAEAQLILDDILAKRDPWRAEWLDAKIAKPGADLFYQYEHKIINNQAIPQKSEKLDSCLMEDCWADIFNGNSQGLPTRKLGTNYEQGKNSYFWYPRSDRVARFGANSDGALLDCDRNPANTFPSLGVFACREAAPKN